MDGLLNSSQIKDALLDPEEKEAWIGFFERAEFDKLPKSKGIGIVPFVPSNLGPVSYDLTVGEHAYSLRRGAKTRLSEQEENIRIEPGETVLILTAEYLALSPKYAGVTLSRARIMNEGIALSSAKIDPTWYGRLLIPVTNTSRSEFKLRRGTSFCTILLFELSTPVDPAKYLNRENTPHLGQNTFEYEPHHASAWQPKRPESVSAEDMDHAVAFGPPFDITRGMFDLNQHKIIDYMEKQWGTKALRELKHSLWDEEFQQIKEYRQAEIKLLKDQVEVLRSQGRAQWTLIITLIAAVVGWIAIAGVLIWKTVNAG